MFARDYLLSNGANNNAEEHKSKINILRGEKGNYMCGENRTASGLFNKLMNKEKSTTVDIHM